MKFTQPVSMQCSQEQFEIDLKEPLEKLGYYLNEVDFPNEEGTLIATNYNSHRGVSNLSSRNKEVNNRHFIDHYNPQLFLSLASMTDEPNGIVGEWVISKTTKNFCEVSEPKLILQGSNYDKATKEELIAHFTKKECKEQESTMENMLGNLNNLANIGKELFGGPDKEEKRSIETKEILVNNNYAEISLRIEGVLTRFIAEKEYQSMIDTYESRIKELEDRTNANDEKIVKIKELLRELNIL